MRHQAAKLLHFHQLLSCWVHLLIRLGIECQYHVCRVQHTQHDDGRGGSCHIKRIFQAHLHLRRRGLAAEHQQTAQRDSPCLDSGAVRKHPLWPYCCTLCSHSNRPTLHVMGFMTIGARYIVMSVILAYSAYHEFH